MKDVSEAWNHYRTVYDVVLVVVVAQLLMEPLEILI
jgi:hypothetical protein